jgi:integrase
MAKERLTERRCQTAKAVDGKRLEIRDELVPGLELRVTPSGIKSWSLLYTDTRTGKKRRLDLGRYGETDDCGVTLAAGRQRARQQIAAVGAGADPAKGVELRREALTFARLAETRLAAMPPLRGGRPRRSLENYRSLLRVHINPVLGELRATEIRKADVKRLLLGIMNATDARFKLKQPATKNGRGRRRKRPGNPLILEHGRTVSHVPNRVFELVRSIFRWGIGEDFLEHDPTIGLKPPMGHEQARSRYLSEAEIPGFWKSLERAPITRQLCLAIQLEIVTGQRTGELIRSKKIDIDRAGLIPVLVIPRDSTKNGKRAHRVSLSPLAMRIITEASALEAKSPYIFPSPVQDGPLTPAAATRAMGRLRPHLAATDLRVHDLRRTASNGMRRLGVPKFIVSLILNHISVTRGDVTTEHYLDEYSFEAEKADGLLKWGEKLEAVLSLHDALANQNADREVSQRGEALVRLGRVDRSAR